MDRGHPLRLFNPLMNNNLTEKKNGNDYLERMEEGTGGGLAASLRGTHWTEETILRGVRQTGDFKHSA